MVLLWAIWGLGAPNARAMACHTLESIPTGMSSTTPLKFSCPNPPFSSFPVLWVLYHHCPTCALPERCLHSALHFTGAPMPAYDPTRDFCWLPCSQPCFHLHLLPPPAPKWIFWNQALLLWRVLLSHDDYKRSGSSCVPHECCPFLLQNQIFFPEVFLYSLCYYLFTYSAFRRGDSRGIQLHLKVRAVLWTRPKAYKKCPLLFPPLHEISTKFF